MARNKFDVDETLKHPLMLHILNACLTISCPIKKQSIGHYQLFSGQYRCHVRTVLY